METLAPTKSASISIDFSCVNCDRMFLVTGSAALYCSKRCQDDAKLVRYVRACRSDGRILDQPVRDAIQIKFAFAFSEDGFYDANARRLPLILRRKVIERDNGLCVKCGTDGTEIDHIDGSQSDLENLQLLCRNCHGNKTRLRLTEISPDNPRFIEIQARKTELVSRIESVVPKRPCDDEQNWHATYRRIMAEQNEMLQRIKEDSEGPKRVPDPSEQALIAEELNEISELERQLQVLETQKQAQIDEILTPQVKAKLEVIETEFDQSVTKIQERIDTIRERVKIDVLRHGSSVRGTGIRVVWNLGRVTWNLKGLEEYSKLNPDILVFRKEGKPFVSFYPIKSKLQ